MSIWNPVLYPRSQVLALQAYGCESEHPHLFSKWSGGSQSDGEGKEGPWWELSRASTGSVFCPACAGGLKEVDGFLKFKKGGEKQKRNCAFL